MQQRHPSLVGLCGLVALALVATPAAARSASAVIGRLTDRRARPGAHRPAPPEDPSLRIVVSEVPPAPPRPHRGTSSRPAGRRHYYGYTRQPTPLYLRKTPGGEKILRLKVGLLLRLLRSTRAGSEVETAGLIRARGWVPSVTLGLRVQRVASLYSRPGGKRIGRVAPGQLVHLAAVRGGWARVRLMGWLPIECWMRRRDLSTAKNGAYRSMRSHYPGGSAMVVSAGPLRGTPGGPVWARAMDEGRVYRVRVSGSWSLVAMIDYRRVDLRLWVKTERLRWGGYPYFGSGYQSSNCVAGASGDHVALSSFSVYAARDDAWPTIRILPKARFRVSSAGDGWVRIYSYGCLRFSAYAERRAGDYAPVSIVGGHR